MTINLCQGRCYAMLSTHSLFEVTTVMLQNINTASGPAGNEKYEMTEGMVANQMENTTAHAGANYENSPFYDPEIETIIRRKFAIARGIWKVVPPCIMVLGTLGNTLSGMVMILKTNRRTVTGLLFFVLAIVDTLVLYTGLLR